MIEFPAITIVTRTVFHENNIYYPQVFLDEIVLLVCLYKI